FEQALLIGTPKRGHRRFVRGLGGSAVVTTPWRKTNPPPVRLRFAVGWIALPPPAQRIIGVFPLVFDGLTAAGVLAGQFQILVERFGAIRRGIGWLPWLQLIS